MKAKFGAIIVAGSGKIGGHVASRNRAGAYIRTKVTPVNPQTVDQTEARARLTALSQAWRSLTADQRAAWNAGVANYARTDIFGDLKNPSGFNLYQRINNNLELVGAGSIDEPAPLETVLVVVLSSLTADASPAALSLALSGAVPAGTYMKIWATAPQSPGVSFVKSEYRIIQIAAPAAATPVNLLAAYTAKFGAFAAGQKIFVKVSFINGGTGQESAAQSISTIAVA